MIAPLLALAMFGQDPAADTPPDMITDPQWIATPTGEDLARYAPAGARGNGGATVECRIDAKGWLKFCHVVAETEPRENWGEATLAVVSRKFRSAKLSKSGQPTEGKLVRIPIQWRLPPSD